MTQHQSPAVACPACGHGYDGHTARGGPCTSSVHPSSGSPPPCSCSGFRWIDADGPSVGSYTDPPIRPA